MRAYLIVMLVLCFQLSIAMLNVVPIFDAYYPNQTAVMDLDNCSINMVNTTPFITHNYIDVDYEIINSTTEFGNDSYHIPVLSELYALTDLIGVFFAFLTTVVVGIAPMLVKFGLPPVIAYGMQTAMWVVFGAAVLQITRGIGTKTMD